MSTANLQSESCRPQQVFLNQISPEGAPIPKQVILRLMEALSPNRDSSVLKKHLEEFGEKIPYRIAINKIAKLPFKNCAQLCQKIVDTAPYFQVVGTVMKILEDSENGLIVTLADFLSQATVKLDAQAASMGPKVTIGTILELKCKELSEDGLVSSELFRTISPDEEAIHYLEIRHNLELESKPRFSEERIFLENSEFQKDWKSSSCNFNIFSYKKIFGAVFFYCLNKADKIRQAGGVITRKEITDISMVRTRMEKLESSYFQKVYNVAIAEMVKSELLRIQNDVYFVNLVFFENLEARLTRVICERKEKEISFTLFDAIFNDMIPNNESHNIMRQEIYNYICKLANHRSIEIADNRHESFRLKGWEDKFPKKD